MPALSVQITRFVDEHQPGIVECVLLDALGQTHIFVEKVPVVSTENLCPTSSYPRPGFIGCEIESEWKDGAGRSITQVNTAQPWGIESKLGATHFQVLSSQLVQA